MKLKGLLIFAVLTACASLQGSAQTLEEGTSSYNLPPGSKIMSKHIITDYSYLISELESSSEHQRNGKTAEFIKPISPVEWEGIKKNNIEEYNYYQTALDYYNRLSDKVKFTLTTEQLWSIYFYQPALAQELLKY